MEKIGTDALSKKKESKPACWPTFNGWAGVIFLPLPVGFPVSGFPVNTPPVHQFILGCVETCVVSASCEINSVARKLLNRKIRFKSSELTMVAEEIIGTMVLVLLVQIESFARGEFDILATRSASSWTVDFCFRPNSTLAVFHKTKL